MIILISLQSNFRFDVLFLHLCKELNTYSFTVYFKSTFLILHTFNVELLNDQFYRTLLDTSNQYSF